LVALLLPALACRTLIWVKTLRSQMISSIVISRITGRMIGRTMCRSRVNPPAPSSWLASRTSSSTWVSAAYVVSVTSGTDVQITVTAAMAKNVHGLPASQEKFSNPSSPIEVRIQLTRP
jgi:hypothetical protein